MSKLLTQRMFFPPTTKFADLHYVINLLSEKVGALVFKQLMPQMKMLQEKLGALVSLQLISRMKNLTERFPFSI